METILIASGFIISFLVGFVIASKMVDDDWMEWARKHGLVKINRVTGQWERKE